MSFTPDELFKAVKKHVPHLQITYKVDARQKIGKYIVIPRLDKYKGTNIHKIHTPKTK